MTARPRDAGFRDRTSRDGCCARPPHSGHPRAARRARSPRAFGSGAASAIGRARRVGASRAAPRPRCGRGATWRVAAGDPDATVRRRAAELAPALGATVPARAARAVGRPRATRRRGRRVRDRRASARPRRRGRRARPRRDRSRRPARARGRRRGARRARRPAHAPDRSRRATTSPPSAAAPCSPSPRSTGEVEARLQSR